ncbi:MAG: cytochrome c [Halioglobus sp.]|jgi:mono/diheme cytochrome c family protein
MAGLKRVIPALVLMVTTAHTSFAETVQRKDAVTVVEVGYERFIDSCAFCHGVDAKGDGPAAGMLEKQPADLTQLAKSNGGSLPLTYVYETIDGRDMPRPHGPKGMPVWGDLWRHSVPDQYAELYVRARILEILLFLDSIQE